MTVNAGFDDNDELYNQAVDEEQMMLDQLKTRDRKDLNELESYEAEFFEVISCISYICRQIIKSANSKKVSMKSQEAEI